jgi:anthranilate synthase component 2
MILLIDNYDSFSYNLCQMVGATRPEIQVIRNDETTVEAIRNLSPECIILSPGPGRPKDAGILVELVKTLGTAVPILGVCLGHQAICEACGATVSYAKTLMHGKPSRISLAVGVSLFAGLPDEIIGARYHSLSVIEETLPASMKVIARAEDGEVMGVAHQDYPIYGLQFHPESILTPEGGQIIRNFLTLPKGGRM